MSPLALFLAGVASQPAATACQSFSVQSWVSVFTVQMSRTSRENPCWASQPPPRGPDSRCLQACRPLPPWPCLRGRTVLCHVPGTAVTIGAEHSWSLAAGNSEDPDNRKPILLEATVLMGMELDPGGTTQVSTVCDQACASLWNPPSCYC